jgi:hypothetical protein
MQCLSRCCSFPFYCISLLSGKLEELKGTGGIEAKFAKTASESITVASEKVKPSLEEVQIVLKESLILLEKKSRQLKKLSRL